jgi:hypothetical protein
MSCSGRGVASCCLAAELSVKPGDTKPLVIERAGHRLTVKAVVARIP